MKTITQQTNPISLQTETLVLGGTGKTGRRIVQRLRDRGLQVRIGSRSESPAFDWADDSNWESVVEGASAIYIAYHPDLAAPGAAKAIEALVRIAEKKQIQKLVLLSGRGEPEAQRCEGIVRSSSIPSTVVRCAWFNQNFSENFMREMVVNGLITLPVRSVLEPFVDADDIADVSVAALTDDRHNGELYELTGPELLSFADVAAILAKATGRPVEFANVPLDPFMTELRSTEMPAELADLIEYLMSEVLDGRNAWVGDGVQRALGRPPRDFATYAKATADAGFWS